MEITVIIPVKDRREYIGKTLDSIMKSSELPTELIIVDNGSTDGTYEFCEQYIKDIPYATLLKETFPGSSAARNKGLKSCKTEWVYFFDSDDEFDSEFLPTMNLLPVDDHDMIVVPTKMQVKGNVIARKYIPSPDPRVQMFAGVLNTQSMVFRTDFLKGIGAWNTECRIWNDWELGLRAILHQPKILWYGERDFHLVNAYDNCNAGKSSSENYKAFIRTLSVAMTDLHSSILQPLSTYHAQHLNCIYPHLDQLIYPLYLRTSILLGKMQGEKMTGKSKNNKLAAKSLKIFRNDHFHPTASQKGVANMLRLYTKFGGKNAWRVALAICQAEQKSRSHK